MKKITPNPPESAALSDADAPDLSQLSETTERTISARLRNPNHPDPISHVFTLLPDVDTPTLLAHACETLASLNVMTTDLACDLEGSRRTTLVSGQGQ
ncbi:DUF6124 family protein [Pseudomonas sp. NPDC099000]|uniref:DUF6124 family protein n=1 Tax=Pseudomonas sp. NPDC099000 TaxID=3364488 RepID=UPI003839E5EB